VERWLIGEHPLFSVPAYKLNTLGELPFYLLLGLLAGVAAYAFNVSLLRLRAWCSAQRHVPTWATPGAGGLVVGVLGLTGLLATGSASVFGVGYQQLALGLQGPLPLKLLIVLGALKLAATVVSYSSGSSGGIFGPSLYIGGMMGGVVGLLAASMLGEGTAPGAFALVGMGAVFAGIVRAPITSIVIIFEMTNNYSIILPLMAANITSYALARRLSPAPIYDALLLQDGLHLPHASGHALRKVQVATALIRDATTLDATWTVVEARDRLHAADDRASSYAVLDAEGHLVGMVEASEIGGAMEAGRGSHRIGALARPASVHAHPDHSLDTALVKLGRLGASALPVVSRKDTKKLLGIVTMRAIAVAMAREAAVDDDAGRATSPHSSSAAS
jgi:CIC family chloride channel protein